MLWFKVRTAGSDADGHHRLDITHAQQDILRDVYGTDDLSGIAQMWCMYKEVAGYYMNGVSFERRRS